MAGEVVVGVDDTVSALHAVRWGAGEAARRGVAVRLVHAYSAARAAFPELERSVEDVRVELRRRGADLLDRAAAAVADRMVPVQTELRAGDPRVVLVDESRHAGLAVLGAAMPTTPGGLLIGSVGLVLAVQGRCPLVVVRGAAPERGPVVAGADAAPGNAAALGFAFAEAALAGVSLTLVRSWTGVPADATARHEQERQALEAQISPWRERFPQVQVDAVVVRGRPGAVLLEYGAHARLIVVGSRGRGEVTELLLDSTSRRVARHAPCPVAIVRADLVLPPIPAAAPSDPTDSSTRGT